MQFTDAVGSQPLQQLRQIDTAIRAGQQQHFSTGRPQAGHAGGLVLGSDHQHAPRLLGPGRGMAALPELPALDAALGFDFQDCQRIGTDLRLLVRRQGADAFLHSPPPAALA